MGDAAASVLARLKNKAIETGRSYQLCLQLFCQEEFVRRLEKSKYADNFILKGGLFLYTATGYDSRVTVDIDFLLRQMPGSPQELRPIIEEIISVETGNDFVFFEIKELRQIALMKKYPGIGISLLARIKNTRTPINIDFGIGDIIVPLPQKLRMPTQLSDFESPIVNAYSIETTIAEKLDAILDLMEYSSRMKDYYDIYYIANSFDFDGNILSQALAKTFENREHHFDTQQFDNIIRFSENEAMNKKWAAFIKRTDVKTDDFQTVLEAINKFLAKPFQYAIENKGFSGRWLATDRCWVFRK